MQFVNALFFAFVAMAAAAPVNNDPEIVNLEPGSGPGVAYALLTVCNNANFGGSCITFTGNLNTCYSLGEYDNAVSSARPGTDGIDCGLFDSYDCSGAGPLITGPANNLNDQGYNDKASSFACHFD